MTRTISRLVFSKLDVQARLMNKIVFLGTSRNSEGGEDRYTLHPGDQVFVVRDMSSLGEAAPLSPVPQIKWASINLGGKTLAEAVAEKMSGSM